MNDALKFHEQHKLLSIADYRVALIKALGVKRQLHENADVERYTFVDGSAVDVFPFKSPELVKSDREV